MPPLSGKDLGDRFQAMWEERKAARAVPVGLVVVFYLLYSLGRGYLNRQARTQIDGDCIRLYRYAFTANDTTIADNVRYGPTGLTCGEQRKRATRQASR